MFVKLLFALLQKRVGKSPPVSLTPELLADVEKIGEIVQFLDPSDHLPV